MFVFYVLACYLQSNHIDSVMILAWSPRMRSIMGSNPCRFILKTKKWYMLFLCSACSIKEKEQRLVGW